MTNINIKLLSEDAYLFFVNHLEELTNKIIENEDNSWIESAFPFPAFVDKKIFVPDFELTDNPDSKDKDIDFDNSVKLFEALKSVPDFILCDVRFWLWLHLDKFYSIVRKMMSIKGISTIRDHWLQSGGTRRGIFFGVLSRCYFRIALTIDYSLQDKYELARWIINNPLRFREFTWRNFSSEKHLIRGCIKGEKKAIEEVKDAKETGELFAKIAKHVSNIGSVRLLDVISEKDIEEMIYIKTKELLLKQEKKEVHNETFC